MPAHTPPPGLYRLDRPLERTGVLEELASVPARLAAIVQGVPEERLSRRPAPGEWSPFQVVCHFRDIALVYGMRFRWIVLDDVPPLPNYDEDRWVAESRDTTEDLDAILAEIAAMRAGVCRLLSRLTDEDWQRTGRHEVLGPVVLDDYVRHELAHEEGHLAQLTAALGV